jgi:hypothetical protein
MSEVEREDMAGGGVAETRGTKGGAPVDSFQGIASAKFKDPSLLLHCYMCQQEKTAFEFHRDRGRQSGYASRCRACTKVHNKTRPGAKAMRKRARVKREASLRRRGRPRKPRVEGHLCRSCKFVMSADLFWSDSTRSDGISRRCKICVSSQQVNEEALRERRRNQKRRKSHKTLLRRNYGLTLDDYQRMLDAQGGVCGICRRPPGKRRLAVDHCHKNGNVRGLLCTRCNTGLGGLGDDPRQIAAALAYLRTPSLLTAAKGRPAL